MISILTQVHNLTLTNLTQLPAAVKDTQEITDPDGSCFSAFMSYYRTTELCPINVSGVKRTRPVSCSTTLRAEIDN